MATPKQKYHERVAKIRGKYRLPDRALVAPGYGCWAAYFDGVILAKSTPGFKPEAVLLQNITNIELQSPCGLRNGSLKFTAGTADGKHKVINFNFLKDEEPAFAHLRDVLGAEKQLGIRGELPPEYRPKAIAQDNAHTNPVPFMGMPDEKFRAKFNVPADAVLARAAGFGYISFDGHFVTIQHIGIQRMTIGKGVKRFPLSAISNIHIKPAGWVMDGYMQITAAGSNEVRSEFGRQSWDARNDENSVTFVSNEQPAFLALRDAIEEAQRNLHAPGPVIQEQAPDVLAQLEKLGNLRDAGILTEEEFAAKKAELLGRL